ncbi:MAG: acyl-CoA thioesterase, partial [Actinomycetota bacterium]|nr:acyl-CoA thioesterase [Actinomycetota bacterium]
YPDGMVVGLRVARLGTSSVSWAVAIDRASDGARVAEGSFVHVFVDRASRRPTPLPGAARTALEELMAPG